MSYDNNGSTKVLRLYKFSGGGGTVSLPGEFALCSNEALAAGLMKVSLKFACNPTHNGELDVLPTNAGSSQVPSVKFPVSESTL